MKSFQDVLSDIENGLKGKSLLGISGTAATFSVEEVDYDNKNIVLNVGGTRKTWTFEKMKKVWDEMYYKPAANVEVVFGGSGSSRNQVETIFACLPYVEWLYIDKKKNIAYIGKETHPYGEIKKMEEAKEAEYEHMMAAPEPRNPLLPEKSVTTKEENEYESAAKILLTHVLEEGVIFDCTNVEVNDYLYKFRERFSPESLNSISDERLLQEMFYTQEQTNDSLCYWLEYDVFCRKNFGSISGGSAFKFGLFQKKEDGIWMTGTGQNPQELTEEEALQKAKSIRERLVIGCELIKNTSLDTVDDYIALENNLKSEVDDFYTCGWVMKYYLMNNPDKMSGYYNETWQRHVLYSLGIKPSKSSFVRNGQIALVKKYTAFSIPDFFNAFYDKFGDAVQFVRIGTSDKKNKYFSNWLTKSIVAIGWNNVGSLADYGDGNILNKSGLIAKMLKEYYPEDKRLASRKAGELATFYATGDNTVFVAMDGESLLALGDNVGAYYYDSKAPFANLKSIKWYKCFSEDAQLPIKAEGHLTSCKQFTDEDNILFLYHKYYFDKDKVFDYQPEVSSDAINRENPKKKGIRFKTGYKSPYPHNRIVFGAPGTGKSYTINQERKDLLGTENEKDYERVTFHPDYSYANFVGTYKPVSCKGIDGKETITYKYVPGPFMRIYVEALKNSRTEHIKPYLLIIEEINRANVAAVFGDVFQLLDRDENAVSEYPIQASEDIKKYLADELEISTEDCSKIRIPDNMFIWATMNSADQGVFPMDTAFKRRWDFTYLGIDDAEGKMSVDIKNRTFIFGEGEDARIVTWNDIRKAINDELSSENYNINEDKLLGPYFMSKTVLEGSEDYFIKMFKNKVLMYLFDDAVKQKKNTFFGKCKEEKKSVRYSEICDAFDEKGVFIFPDNISSQFSIKPSVEKEDTAE